MTTASQVALLKSLTVSARGGWLTLVVAGQGSMAYKLTSPNPEEVVNEIDRFSEALKAVLRGEKLSIQ